MNELEKQKLADAQRIASETIGNPQFWDTDQLRLALTVISLTNVIARGRIDQQGEWQPIETAPKDETAVLLGREGHIPLVGYIGPHRHEWWMPGTGQNIPWEPTHWRRLPAPPH